MPDQIKKRDMPMAPAPAPAPTPAENERAKREAAEAKMDAAQRKAMEDHYNRPIPKRKAGGMIKKMRSGGFVKSADGIASKGKTRGKVC